MPASPILDELELQQVQKVESEDRGSVAQHSVPALEGDFLQDLGRRAVRITLNGVLTGPDAGDGLKKLREKFRKTEPVSFVADIATATSVGQVLIESLDIREVAGKPERFEYGFALREFIPPPPPEVTPPPPQPDPPKPNVVQATLEVEVIVDGQPNFDFSTVTVTVAGKQTDGTQFSRTFTNRTNNVWKDENMPAGQYAATATVNAPQAMSGTGNTTLQAGQTARVTIHLTPGAVIAQIFIVHFSIDKAFIEPCMRAVLRDAADFAKNNPTAKLLILGNTDLVGTPGAPTGSDPYNQSLSERRGRSVFAYLTFGRDAAGALAEWQELRKAQRVSHPTINDNWGLTQVQYMLQDLDFYPGGIDGQDGPLTREAIRAFRCHVGLPPGNTMDDPTWEALIKAYLGQDQLAVPDSQFFPNCGGEILKWTGCASQDPVKNVRTAWRPNRRVELIFTHVGSLPCTIPEPNTFNLPAPGAVNSSWCVGPGDVSHRTCFVVPHLPPGGQPQSNEWLRQPAQPGTLTVQGTIAFDDGRAYAQGRFVLIAPDGTNKADEQPTGQPVPARTDANGGFQFADLPVGVYVLEVHNTTDVLVRLEEDAASTAKGPSVCKVLQSDTDRLNVVILSDPVAREVQLPVVAHLMTALHPLTHAVRTCPSAFGPPQRQATVHTDDEVRAAFATANDVWKQARVSFQLTDIVHEAYSFKTECEIDSNELSILFDRANYGDPNVVNVYFVGDLAGTSEAGESISVESGAAQGIAPGCAIGDRFQFTALGQPIDTPLSADQTAQVLAHELGHYVNLPHADATAANATRLMLPGTATGDNRTLTADEVKTARASKGANDDCVPLTMQVTGATRIGGTLSNRFIVVQGSAGPVTVDAQIPDRMLDPSIGTLVMSGGDAGANNKQRSVNTAANTTVDVTATFTPAGGGQPITRHTIVLVSNFQLQVDGATPTGGAGSTTFVATVAAGQKVTVNAALDPAPFAIPSDLIAWSGGAPADGPQQRTVSGAPGSQTVVSATVAGVTRTATIQFPVSPLLSLDSPFVVVKKPHTSPARRVVTLKTDAPSTLAGTLTKTGTGPVQIFTTATGTTQVTFNGTDNVFTGAQLGASAGVQLFAESTSASTAAEDFQLTLALTASGGVAAGQPVTVKLTAVEITLDVAQTRTSANVASPVLSSTDKIKPGAFVIVQDAGFTHERALLLVHPPKPGVTLTLRLQALNASVQVFSVEQAASGQAPVATPLTIPSATVPATGSQFFVEGSSASSALLESGFRLGIDGLENDADHVVITVFPDPSVPGPFAVGEHEYTRAATLAIPAITETLSDLTVIDVGASSSAAANGAFDAKIHALVRYPAASAGADKPVSGVLAKYPIVVVAHGNHRVLDSGGSPVESFRGLEYLARHYASYGYIAISVDLDVVNTSPQGNISPAIVQRGLVILEHIAFWKVLNTSDPIFTGKVDTDQIALIGHSRGGEAVVSAQKTNLDQARGLKIKAVMSISQTDFLGIVHSSTPYLVIYGSADGDVSIGWPFRLYDRASPFKALVFVYGANHNRFSTSPDWLAQLDLDPATDNRIIAAADHLNVAQGYSLGFLQLVMRGVGDHVLLFKNNARPSAISAAVEMHVQVQDQPPRLTVDSFEQGAFTPATAHGPQLAARATTNTLGQTVSQTGLAIPAPPATNPALNSLSNALTEGSLRHRDLDFFWNDTFGELLAWDAAGATYTQPLGTQDVSSFLVLTFRVTQRFGSPRNPAPPAASPDFSITLKDSAAGTATVTVGSIGAIPVPYVRVDDATLTKSALTTVRMPLTSFTNVNATLDLHSVTAVIFEFAQTARGEIAIDDLEFSN